MKMLKSLAGLVASVALSTAVYAAPAQNAGVDALAAVANQNNNFWDVIQYCRENPRDCYCYVRAGRTYCTLL